MKVFYISLLIIAVNLISLNTNNLYAQTEPKKDSYYLDYKGESTKFALMVGNTRRFTGALSLAKRMQIKKNNYQYSILVYGELAKALAKDESLLPQVAEAKKLGINIYVCEVALSYFNIPKEELDSRLQTTPDVWLKFFELKDEGYNTLNL